VWREFDTAGPAADGTVQLDWVGEAGTLPGHSGGPVIDPDTGALLGVLVQGSERGRFDRFLPLSAIALCCPGLPRPWLMAGADSRSHFTRRSQGQRSRAREGDLFRGRRAALAVVRDWLTADEDAGVPLVVTGQPGAGKSAVLARVALGLEADRIGPGLAFHARGADHSGLLSALADLIGVEQRNSRDAVLDALYDASSGEPVLIVVDALDEAASTQDWQQMAETLADLAAAPRMRVAVATRRLAAGDWYAPGGVLPALGIASQNSPVLIDLDADRYFEFDGLRQFAAALLAQDGAHHPMPADGSWTRYRSDPELCQRLAATIAIRAQRNYLVTAMAAVPLSAAKDPLDPAAADFHPASIPGGVGEALAKYLDTLPDYEQPRIRGLLTALAYARSTGITDRTWLAFTAALGYPATMADLDRLRSSSAADYLLQTITDQEGARTRLFHQALTDELLARRHQPSDEKTLLDALNPSDLIPLGLGGYFAGRRDMSERAWHRAAEAGHAPAMTALGVMLSEAGRSEEAEQWWRRAADAGDIAAILNLTNLLEDQSRNEEAEQWWRTAADAGDTHAMSRLASLLRRQDRDEEAEQWWRSAAEAGDASAMTSLGILLAQERRDEAEQWYRRGAEAGNAQAMFYLAGWLYERGGREEAGQWWRRAADAGDAYAMHNLGVQCHSADRDEEAEQWYRRAAAAGHPGSMTNLGSILHRQGRDEEAEQLCRRAATMGLTGAMGNLSGLLQQLGRGEEAEQCRRWAYFDQRLELAALFHEGGQDDKAEPLWRQAADAGHPRAIYNLGVLLYEKGQHEEADRLWRQAADSGVADAMFNLGILLNVSGRREEAEHRWQQAAEAGHPGAMLNLANMLNGTGRREEAEQWYRHAAAVQSAGTGPHPQGSGVFRT
jgi:TPR repeat protein